MARLKPDEVVVKNRHGGTAEALLEEAGVEIKTVGNDRAGAPSEGSD